MKVKKQNRKLLLKVAGGIAAVFLCFYLALRLVPYRELDDFMHRQNSSCFYDRNGCLVYVMPLEEGLRREYVPLKNIPKKVTEAFVKQEDASF